MLFPALGHGHHHHRCEQSPGSLSRNGPHSRCSCDSSYAAPSGFSRLLPAISSEQPINPSNIQVQTLYSSCYIVIFTLYANNILLAVILR